MKQEESQKKGVTGGLSNLQTVIALGTMAFAGQ
eukprot:CAMPEP_0181410600 /NCGR_PEP_ID=MMETSP1110-20121109/7423_1 /TAXON_ID=174948 /ORGANISM="Symbiodinium sp., Strain CCMP421" /LENGTH=32 /DNA_ID= /DNA_START= /DNA_END= /DNA_ORIENTATION=